jgi:hypothetical protein
MRKGLRPGLLWSDIHIAAKLATAAFVLWMLCVFVFTSDVLPKSFVAASFLCVVLQVLPIPFSIWFFISKWRNRELKGSLLATVSAIVPLCVLLASFAVGSSLDRIVYKPHAIEMRCQANLKKLYAGLAAYAGDHAGLLPDGHNWCDALITGQYVDSNDLVCPAAKTPCRSSYTLISSVAGVKLNGLTTDTVLVYEDICGWNQTSPTVKVHEIHHVVAERRLVDVLCADGAVRSYTDDIANIGKK